MQLLKAQHEGDKVAMVQCANMVAANDHAMRVLVGGEAVTMH